MTKKAPPEVLSPSDLAYMSTLNERTYDIKRPIDESYQKRLARQVVFAQELGKWNYLVKPAN